MTELTLPSLHCKSPFTTLILMVSIFTAYGESAPPPLFVKEWNSVNQQKQNYLNLFPKQQHEKLILDIDNKVTKQIPTNIISLKANCTKRAEIDQLFDEYINSFLEEKVIRRFYCPKGWWIDDLCLKNGSIISGYLLDCNQKDSLTLHKRIWIRLGNESASIHDKEMKIMFAELAEKSRIRFEPYRKTYAEKYKKEIMKQYLSGLSESERFNIFINFAKPHGFLKYQDAWYAPEEVIFIIYYAPIYHKVLLALHEERQKELLTPIHTKKVHDIMLKAKQQVILGERLDTLKEGEQYNFATNIKELKDYIALTEHQEKELRERIAKIEEAKRIQKEAAERARLMAIAQKQKEEADRKAKEEAERRAKEKAEAEAREKEWRKEREKRRKEIEEENRKARERKEREENFRRKQGKKPIYIKFSDGGKVRSTSETALKIQYFVGERIIDTLSHDPSNKAQWVKVKKGDEVYAKISLTQPDNSITLYETDSIFYNGEYDIVLTLKD